MEAYAGKPEYLNVFYHKEGGLPLLVGLLGGMFYGKRKFDRKGQRR